LLAREAQVMLTVNLWTEAGLVNSSMRIIQDMLFKENQRSLSFSIVVLISFNNYKGPIITSLEGKNIILIASICHI